MKIGELAERSGLAASAIRYYEQAGLLPRTGRGANGYRMYTEATLRRLHVIRVGQKLGFSLDAIRGVIDKEGSELQGDMLRGVDVRLGEIEQMMATLAEQREELLTLRDKLRHTWAQDDCLFRHELGEPAALLKPAKQV